MKAKPATRKFASTAQPLPTVALEALRNGVAVDQLLRKLQEHAPTATLDEAIAVVSIARWLAQEQPGIERLQ